MPAARGRAHHQTVGDCPSWCDRRHRGGGCQRAWALNRGAQFPTFLILQLGADGPTFTLLSRAGGRIPLPPALLRELLRVGPEALAKVG